MKYSLKELLLNEYSEKVYKILIERFKKQNRNLDEENIRYYVQRFEQLQPKIRAMFEKRVGATDAEKNTEFEKIEKLIPKNIQEKNKYLDILQWHKFTDIEKIVDIFPASKGQQKKSTQAVVNSAETDANKIYDADGIEIYKGDSQHACVKYGSGDGKAEKYSWCISRAGDVRSMYGSYRFREGSSRMFYFVFDRNRPSGKTGGSGYGDFVDPLHAIVIHVYENGKYKITNADNSPGEEPNTAVSFDELLEYISTEYARNKPQKIVNALRSLKKEMIKYVPPSEEETELQVLRGKILTADQFQQLSYRIKTIYVQNNATTLNSDIFKLLDVELKNLAINNDRKCSYEELKGNQGLLKRYPVYRYTRHPKIPLPPIFIPLLPEELKVQYYKDFKDDYLTFEFIKEYLGESITKKYVLEELNNFGYLPPNAMKYLSSEQKNKYDEYSLCFADHTMSKSRNVQDVNTAEEQNLRISPISQETYVRFDAKQKNDFINTIKTLSQSGKEEVDEKYPFLALGLPLVFYIKGKFYFVVFPKKDSYDSHDLNRVLIDQNGKTLITNIDMDAFDITKKGKSVKSMGELQFIEYSPSNSNNIYFTENDFDAVEINGESYNLNTFVGKLNEQSIFEYNDLAYRMGVLAGIIK